MSQQTIRKWSISNVKNKMTFFSSKKEIQTFNTDVRQNSVESFGPLEDAERRTKIRFEALIEQPGWGPTGWVGRDWLHCLIGVTLTGHRDAIRYLPIFSILGE